MSSITFMACEMPRRSAGDPGRASMPSSPAFSSAVALTSSILARKPSSVSLRACIRFMDVPRNLP